MRGPSRCATAAVSTSTTINAQMLSISRNRKAAHSAHSDCCSSADAMSTTFGRNVMRAANATVNPTTLRITRITDARTGSHLEVMARLPSALALERLHERDDIV